MPKDDYQAGYEEAANFNWNVFSLDILFYAVDAYKEMALRENSAYHLGRAKKVLELAMERPVSAT